MNKLKEKIDHLLWAFVWVIPIIGYLIAYWRIGSAPPIFTYITENFQFEWIKNILDNILSTAFQTEFAITGYISYLVGVEIIHVMFDIIVFIPRFAHDMIEWGTNLGKCDKWGKK